MIIRSDIKTHSYEQLCHNLVTVKDLSGGYSGTGTDNESDTNKMITDTDYQAKWRRSLILVQSQTGPISLM